MEPTEKTTTQSAAADSRGNGQTEAGRRATRTAHATVDRVAERAHDTVDRVADGASRAADSLDRTGEQFAETGERMMAQTRSYVQMHPVASIGIAVAAGFLLSRLLRTS